MKTTLSKPQLPLHPTTFIQTSLKLLSDFTRGFFSAVLTPLNFGTIWDCAVSMQVSMTWRSVVSKEPYPWQTMSPKRMSGTISVMWALVLAISDSHTKLIRFLSASTHLTQSHSTTSVCSSSEKPTLNSRRTISSKLKSRPTIYSSPSLTQLIYTISVASSNRASLWCMRR